MKARPRGAQRRRKERRGSEKVQGGQRQASCCRHLETRDGYGREDPAAHLIRPSRGQMRPRGPDSDAACPVTGQGCQRSDYSTSTQHARFLSESPRSSLTANSVLASRSSLPRHATSVIHRGHLSQRRLADTDGLLCGSDHCSLALASCIGGWDGVLGPSALRGQICPSNSLRGR